MRFTIPSSEKKKAQEKQKPAKERERDGVYVHWEIDTLYCVQPSVCIGSQHTKGVNTDRNS